MGKPDVPEDNRPIQLLDSKGSLVTDDDPPLSPEALTRLYFDMRLARRLDERGVSLQRQGTFGIYGEVAGQEAAFVASSYALNDADWVIPSYREYPALRAHGLPLRYVFAWFMGHARGNELPPEVNALPLCIPIATQLPHAVGIAHAASYNEDDLAVLAHFGDGATSEGDFHEALNIAGVFDLPTIFFCNNNQWAISTPSDQQTASDSLAAKARAYGFDGVRVDGMDPLAVYAITRWAREKSLADDHRPNPTMIEAVAYRFGAHSTADDPSVYRDQSDVDRWRQRDPLDRTETYLRNRGELDDDRIEAMDDEIDDHIQAELEAAKNLVDRPAEMFDDVFAAPTASQEEQRNRLEILRDRYGDERFSVE